MVNKFGLFLLAFISIADAEELATFDIPESGIYRITYEQLLNEGLDFRGVEIERLGLKMNNQIVAHKIESDGSQYFTDSTYIEFPAVGVDTRYTAINKYVLVIDEGRKIISKDRRELLEDAVAQYSYREQVSYAPQNKHTHYSPDMEDSWYADRLLAISAQANKQVTLELKDYAAAWTRPVDQEMDLVEPEVEVNLWGGSALFGNGLTAPDHHVLLELNNQLISNVQFDGIRTHKLKEKIITALNDGANQLNIRLPNDHGYPFDLVYLDSIKLFYPRKFKAIDKNTLQFSSRWDSFSVSNLISADLVIYRIDSSNHIVEIMTKQIDCMDMFAGCRVDFPGSERNITSQYYLAEQSGIKTPRITTLDEQVNLSATPAKALLLSHPDFINTDGQALESYALELAEIYGSSDIVNIEQIYAHYSGHVRDAKAIARYISDAYYNRDTTHVVLVGGDSYDYRDYLGTQARSFVPSLYVRIGLNLNSVASDAKYADIDGDNIPDLEISRLPVRVESELETLLKKRTNYLRRDYRNKAILSADRVDTSGFSFKSGSQQSVQGNFTNWKIDSIYLDDVDLIQARENIIKKVNQGVSLLSFFGHSSTNRWSLGGLLRGDDVATLENIDKPTVVAQWGCWNAFYTSPLEESMAQRFLFEDGGAVTVMGPVSLSQAEAENEMAKLLYGQLSKGERISQAVLSAKKIFSRTNPYQYDVLLGWNVLGPSDMVLNRVQ